MSVYSHTYRPPAPMPPPRILRLPTSSERPPLGDPVRAATIALERSSEVYPPATLPPFELWRDISPPKRLPTSVDPVPLGTVIIDQAQNLIQLGAHDTLRMTATAAAWLLRELRLPTSVDPVPIGNEIVNQLLGLTPLVYQPPTQRPELTAWLALERMLPTSVDPVPLGAPFTGQQQDMTPLVYAPPALPGWLAAWLLRELRLPTSVDPVPLGNPFGIQTATAWLYGVPQLSAVATAWALVERMLPQTLVTLVPPPLGPPWPALLNALTAMVYPEARLGPLATWASLQRLLPVLTDPPLGAPLLALANTLTAMFYPAADLGVVRTWLLQTRLLAAGVDRVPLGDPWRTQANEATPWLYAPPALSAVTAAWLLQQRILPPPVVTVFPPPLRSPFAALEALLTAILYPAADLGVLRPWATTLQRRLPTSVDPVPLGNPLAGQENAATSWLYAPAQLSAVTMGWLLHQLLLQPGIDAVPLGDPMRARNLATVHQVVSPAPVLGPLTTWLLRDTLLPISVEAPPIGDVLRALTRLLTPQLYPAARPGLETWLRRRLLPTSIERPPLGDPMGTQLRTATTWLYAPPRLSDPVLAALFRDLITTGGGPNLIRLLTSVLSAPVLAVESGVPTALGRSGAGAARIGTEGGVGPTVSGERMVRPDDTKESGLSG